MNNFIEQDIYPLTIIADRYTGAYSGGEYLAFNLDFYEIPEDVNGDDCACNDFWGKNKIPVGKGYTIEEALANLYILLRKGDENGEL